MPRLARLLSPFFIANADLIEQAQEASLEAIGALVRDTPAIALALVRPSGSDGRPSIRPRRDGYINSISSRCSNVFSACAYKVPSRRRAARGVPLVSEEADETFGSIN
jgi:hypothetical protein